VDALAASVICLQVAGSVALPCGVEAALFMVLRAVSKLDLIVASDCGAFLEISVKQASYFLIYSSHSATPVLVRSDAVVLVVSVAVVLEVVVVVFAGFAAVFDVELVAPPPQPKDTTAKHTAAAIAKTNLILIYLDPSL
jgi:hypothetical protein